MPVSGSKAAAPRSTGKRLKVAIACQNCRRKKVKCDGRRPETAAAPVEAPTASHDGEPRGPDPSAASGECGHVAPGPPLGRFARDINAAVTTKLGPPSAERPTLPHAADVPLFGVLGRPAVSYQGGENVLPPREEADALINIYWGHIQPLEPFVDKRTLSPSYQALFAGSPGHDLSSAPGRLLLSTLNAIFALATQLQDSLSPEVREETSKTYFHRAWALLRPETVIWEPASVETVQFSTVALTAPGVSPAEKQRESDYQENAYFEKTLELYEIANRAVLSHNPDCNGLADPHVGRGNDSGVSTVMQLEDRLTENVLMDKFLRDCAVLCIESAQKMTELVDQEHNQGPGLGSIMWWHRVFYLHVAGTVLLASMLQADDLFTQSVSLSWQTAMRALRAHAHLSVSVQQCVATFETLSAKLSDAQHLSSGADRASVDPLVGCDEPFSSTDFQDMFQDMGIDLDSCLFGIEDMAWTGNVL
ncbi:hypothetical protein SLS64_003610 [Diaporthe eres]|uniref:Zn(2)-C6 fungal-type domain-containing protein n=1 Tax=Diaporthe eres TaxID=83184 RepID=A0ABR1NP73_DIAER